MLIMRFHKLIQSRIVWIVFSVIIVISFVGLQVAGDRDRDSNLTRLNQSVAKINGKDVSFLRFDLTRRLMARQTPGQVDGDMLEDLTFNHIAMVEYAESVGIKVEPEFARMQFFSEFTSEEQVELFRSQIRGSQLSETDFIEFLRERLVIDQLRRAMSGAMVVSDFDAERWADLQTSEFVVAYAPIGPEALPEPVTADDAAVQALFDANPEQFPLPEKRIVNYLVVPPALFSNKVEAPTEEEAKERYQANREQFTRTVDVPATEEGGEATSRKEPIPFPDVKNRILGELVQERAQAAAEETALNLVMRMTPRRGRSPESIQSLGEELGLAVVTTPAFSQRDNLDGVVNTFMFKREAFEFSGGEFSNVAGPVSVTGGFAVMELVEIVPPGEATLADVRAQVQRVADREAQVTAVAERAEELAEELRTAMAEGTSFSDAATAAKLIPLTSDPISMMTMDPRQQTIPLEILNELTGAKTGELLGPLDTRFGRYFVATVLSRTSMPVAREEALSETRQMLAEQLQFQGTFQRFQETIIQPMIEKL